MIAFDYLGCCGVLSSADVAVIGSKVVESGGKNIEIGVMTKDGGLRQLEESEIDTIVAEIEVEKEAAEAARRGPARET
ncbi:hypothetical protein GIB67_015773 [Kingdonia uniflora]|uniref:Uncharacterized protein n=1 Tax=Kingdonia uniflora TaxID=39325 RepID=A0A7J7NUG3_9MAGN|nr:hypothetical protein GIB67_015773 [Kingdonia uniflora]